MKFLQDLGTKDIWILGGFLVIVLFFGGGESDPTPQPVKASQPIAKKRTSPQETYFEDYEDQDDQFDLEDPESWEEDEEKERSKREESGMDEEVTQRRDVPEKANPARALSPSSRELAEPTEVVLNKSVPQGSSEQPADAESLVAQPQSTEPDDGLDIFGKHAAELRDYMDSDDFGSEYAD